MLKATSVSNSVIKRLPRYYRFLGDLQTKGLSRISSKELSKRMGLTASQIRQDLNCFGEFGQQGYGYNIELLRDEIGKILGLQTSKKAILIGAGHMGRALTMHFDMSEKGFNLIGIFDKKPSLSGQTIQDLPIHGMDRLDEFCRENKPHIAILCIPKESAHDVTETLVKLGVKGFWNFSHYDLSVDFPDIIVENVHLSDSLMTLCYNVTHNE
ncbi:MAG: redox-sensing transcriptional repressor Rex [Ruminococcaceae bacterium]|nr:redox-sensing transcriptional repressor Rex [Oscillospiraceae bacterium]